MIWLLDSEPPDVKTISKGLAPIRSAIFKRICLTQDLIALPNKCVELGLPQVSVYFSKLAEILPLRGVVAL